MAILATVTSPPPQISFRRGHRSPEKGAQPMHKRAFLGLLASILGAAPGRRLLGRVPDDTPPEGAITNWAGNYRYSTDNLVTLSSVEQVRSYVRTHDSL